MSKKRPRSLPKNRNAQCKFASIDLYQNHFKDLLKHRLLGLTSFRVQEVLFLIDFKVKSILLVWGPHFENHWQTVE